MKKSRFYFTDGMIINDLRSESVIKYVHVSMNFTSHQLLELWF